MELDKRCLGCGKYFRIDLIDNLCKNCEEEILLLKWDSFSERIKPYRGLVE